MKRRFYFFALAALFGLFLIGSDFDAPDVTVLNFVVVADSAGNEGAGIMLSWAFPNDWSPGGGGSGCYGGNSRDSGYFRIYADGVVLGTTDTNFFYVYTPARIVGVVAVYDETNESDPLELDLSAVQTSGVTIWSINDLSPDHPSGFGFSLYGTACSYSCSNEPQNVDYWLYQDANGTLVSPSDHTPPYNSELNVISQTSLGTFENVLIVPGSGSYISQQALAQNEVRGLWFEGDDSHEYFAKMQVSSLTVSGGVIQADLKLACQTYAGLRWVVTE